MSLRMVGLQVAPKEIIFPAVLKQKGSEFGIYLKSALNHPMENNKEAFHGLV